MHAVKNSFASTVFVAIVISAMSMLSAAQRCAAGDAEYFKQLFAQPTAEELQEVWDATRYDASCVDFVIGDEFRKLESGTVYSLGYTSDGFAQTGLIAKPEVDGPYKVLILNHFGVGGITDDEMVTTEEFLQLGYMVALATYRGEIGLAGESEGDMEVLGDEVHDVLNLLECVAALPDADPDKIVMMGTSHGGGLTISALGHTDRIKAAATLAAPVNVMGKPMQAFVRQWLKQPSSIEVLLQVLVSDRGLAILKDMLGVSERDLSSIKRRRFDLIRRSPALYIDRITIPIRMYLGDSDPVSFPEDAIAIEKSLTDRGIFSKATVYENNSHAIMPENYMQAKQEIREMFEKVLSGQPLQ